MFQLSDGISIAPVLSSSVFFGAIVFGLAIGLIFAPIPLEVVGIAARDRIEK